MERPNPTPKKQPSLAEGVAFLVVGLVVFVPSGLCTGFFSFEALVGPDWTSALMPLAIGGPFVFGGGWLLWLGYKNVRGYFRKSAAPDQF